MPPRVCSLPHCFQPQPSRHSHKDRALKACRATRTTRCIVDIARASITTIATTTITITGTTVIMGTSARAVGVAASRLLIAGPLAAMCMFAQASPATPSARELHAAQCVAALQVSTETLARQVKAGNEAARPILQSRLEAETAFVGDAYLQGTTDEPRARALANDALVAQRSLSASELSARQEACTAEGSTLLASSNGFERAIVKRMARKRMDKLLGG